MAVAETCMSKALHSQIAKSIKAGLSVTEVKAVKKKLGALLLRPQSFFQIPKAYQSTDDWSAATMELREMNAAHLPTDKLKALLGASQAIFGSFAAEQRRKNHSSSGESGDIPVLGADDFLPIFIFCTVRAELEQPMYDKALMWSLCDGDMLAGEGGYYLTVFEAALEYVKQVPLL